MQQYIFKDVRCYFASYGGVVRVTFSSNMTTERDAQVALLDTASWRLPAGDTVAVVDYV